MLLDREDAARHVRGLFEPSDRLAIVLLNKRAGTVTQRIASAERIASPEFQAWLHYENARRSDVYISMNVLSQEAQGRTKNDVAVIRHIYLDFDENGSDAVRAVFNRPDMPVPSLIVNTSPDKWQVIWQAVGFTKEEAERLQRHLAREMGADPAATDCARVLRLPGFYNHKYTQPYLVRAEPHAALAGTVYLPEHFPKFPADRELPERGPKGNGSRSARSGGLSQSERDWAYAKRALARGESEELVIAAIATWRRFDKHNPHYYAEITVRKAAESLSAERAASRFGTEGPQPPR